jgi:MSHA pilin protein MshC
VDEGTLMNRICRKNNKNRQHGFTLLEVIAVIVIVSVLAAVAVSRFASTSSTSLVAETDILKAHLRYAQYRAMSDVMPWRLSFSTTTYSLSYYDESTSQWKSSTLPNEASGTHSLEKAGVTLTVAGGDGSSIYFNEWGNPVNASNNLLSSPQIVLTAGGKTQTISITTNTGFIP